MKAIANLPAWVLKALILPLGVLNGWALLALLQYLQPLLRVVVTAALLAFILSFPTMALQRLGLKRIFAAIAVFALALLAIGLASITVAPVAIQQFQDLVTRLPNWIASSNVQFQALQSWAAERHIPLNLANILGQLASTLSAQLQALTGQTLDFLFSTINRLLDFVLILVLTFYLVLHGDSLWDGIFQWLPQTRYIGALRPALRQNFRNYFVSQAILAALMGTAMTVTFLLMQVPFGFLFGVGIGLAALLPFGGALSIAAVSFLVALNSVWLGLKVLIVATLIDQAIENGVAPRLLGHLTGLNPAWVLVSLLLGARMAGLLGLLLAVPIASTLKATAEAVRQREPQPSIAPIPAPSPLDTV
jgi:predicted PurR-regulated permease PerM